MVSEVKKLYDESDGLKIRVDRTEERLNNVKIQFEKDQESINNVTNAFLHNTIVFDLKIIITSKCCLK